MAEGTRDFRLSYDARKYFEKIPQKPKHIATVREKGYQFESGPKS